MDFSINQWDVVNKQYYTEMEQSASVEVVPDLTIWNQRHLENVLCSKVQP